jgi:hypothetical protein
VICLVLGLTTQTREGVGAEHFHCFHRHLVVDLSKRRMAGGVLDGGALSAPLLVRSILRSGPSTTDICASPRVIVPMHVIHKCCYRFLFHVNINPGWSRCAETHNPCAAGSLVVDVETFAPSARSIQFRCLRLEHLHRRSLVRESPEDAPHLPDRRTSQGHHPAYLRVARPATLRARLGADLQDDLRSSIGCSVGDARQFD